MSEWRVAIGQKQYGPYSLEKLREIYREGRVPAEAQVWHPGKNEWIKAADVPELQDDEVDGEIVIVEDSFPSPKSPARKTPASGRETDDSIADFLAFRRMITPVIIQIIFWIGAVLASLAGIFVMIGGIRIDDLGTTFLGFFSMLLGPIAVRIYCELLIVIFRMNETLTDIRNELKRKS
jgi:hypothetical protein